MKRSFLMLLACAALAACGSQDAPSAVEAGSVRAAAAKTVSLDQPFEIKVGKTVQVAGEGLSISFEGVPSDSRCPVGVQCVWAGNAVVQLVLSKDGKAAGVELNTGLEPRSATYLNYEVELLGLAPEATQGGLSQNQYVATLVVRYAPVQ